MKIGLYNLEPKYTNLALEKIRVYYQSYKYQVEYISPIEANQYDAIYCSSIFDFTNKDKVPPNFICGGTGFNLTTKLPSEIDAIEPHINQGFTTRGCNNSCSFCVVKIKEGNFYIVCDVLTIWDGKSKFVILYDNNILTSPEHFELNAKQAHDYKITLDYNQGLDHRKLTPEIVDLMKYFPHKEYRFAFDNPNSINTVEKAIDLLQSKGINRCSWYVLAGYDTTHEEDLFRLNYLRSRNQNAYLQRYKTKKNNKDLYLITLARWVNQHHIFQGMTWEQFLKHPDNRKYKYLIGEH